MEPEQLIALGFMVASSLLLVYVGSKRSLPFAVAGKGEMLSKGDAAGFPITGSLVLFSLYCILKLVPRYVVNWMLSSYLTLISIKSLTSCVRPWFGANVVVGLAAIGVGVAYFKTNHWVANNLLAYAIAIVGIEAIQLKTYAVSSILLIGLFLYDIFWVFGTDVMVTVAKGIDGPIKLVFPQNILGDHEAKTMLGLGDIVIPGFFISQMYRFSCAMGRKGFYLHVALVAYFLSLVNTMVVMVVFKHAQPALLYIVPWLLISTVLVAMVRGDLAKLFSFDQEVALDDKHKKDLIKEGLVLKSDVDAGKDEEEFDADIGQLLWLEFIDMFGMEESYKKELIAAHKKNTAAEAKQKNKKAEAVSEKKEKKSK